MRRQVVDALTIILPFFIQIAPSDAQAWRSCETLLQTCQQRKEQQMKWNFPPPLHAVLVEIARLADEKRTPESKRVGDLSRSLTRPASHPISLPAKPPPPAAPPPLPVLSNATDAVLGKRRAGRAESDVLGERQGGQKLSIKGQHDRQRRKRKDSPPHQPARSVASTPASGTEGGALASSMKRPKTMADSPGETPSLLLRMGHTQRPGRDGRKTTSKSPPALQQSQQRSGSPRRSAAASSAGLPDISLGISIKGAARSHSHSHSLLERIQGDGT